MLIRYSRSMTEVFVLRTIRQSIRPQECPQRPTNCQATPWLAIRWMETLALSRWYCNGRLMTIVAQLHRQQMENVFTAKWAKKICTRRYSTCMLWHPNIFYRNGRSTSRKSMEPSSHGSRIIVVDAERSAVVEDTISLSLLEETHGCWK